MKVIKIEEAKKDKMAECAEKALKSMGKLMQYIEDLGEDDYGDRDDDWEDDDFDDEDFGQRGYRMRRENTGGGSMGQRRSRRTGRFIR